MKWLYADDPVFQNEIGYIDWYYLKSKDGWDNTSPDNDNHDGYTIGYANHLMSEVTKNGSDKFGFSLLPSGWFDYHGRYAKKGQCTVFWMSDEQEIDIEFENVGQGNAYAANYFCYGYSDYTVLFKSARASVRCVKD